MEIAISSGSVYDFENIKLKTVTVLAEQKKLL
jgi:hypothetical protein